MKKVLRTETFAGWLHSRAVAKVTIRTDRLADGNPGDVKAVGHGLSELRIDYCPGYRVYYGEYQQVTIILLVGGTKGSQDRGHKRSEAIVCRVDGAAKMTKVLPYDSAEFLATPEAVAAYMDEALATNDAAFITHALGTIARAKSMTEIARKTGLSRESLYRSLSTDGRPELSTIMKVMKALDIQLTAQVTTQVRKPVIRPVKRKTNRKAPLRRMAAMA